MRARPLFALASALALVACSHATTTAPAGQNDENAAARTATRPVIAALRTHDAKVSIVGGRAGTELRVVVRKDDGTVLADGATLEELRTKDPETWEAVTSALANKGSFFDATYAPAPPPKPF